MISKRPASLTARTGRCTGQRPARQIRTHRRLDTALAIAAVGALIFSALAVPGSAASGPGLDLAAAVEAALDASPELRLARLQALEAELALLAAEVEKTQGKIVEYLEAQRTLEAAQSALRGAAATVAIRAEEAFYSALRARDLLELRRRAAEQAGTQAAIARARYEAGMLSLLDRLEVELASETAGARLDDAQRDLDDALLSLSELTGLSPLPALLWSGDEPASTPLAVDLEQASAQALSAHGDIAAARFALEAAERRLELARLSDSPPVEIRRVEIEVERAKIRLDETVARIRQEVRQSYAALMGATRDVTLKEKALSLALKRLEIARTRYDAGATSLVDLFAAENRAMEARLDAASALWDYNLKKSRFLRLITTRD